MAIRNNQDDDSVITWDDSANLLVPTPIAAMQWINFYTGGGSSGDNGTTFAVWVGANDRAWRLRIENPGMLRRFVVSLSFNGSSNDQLNSVTQIDLDEFNHVGFDFDGTDIRLFINGVLDTTFNAPGTLFTTPGANVSIAGNSDGGAGGERSDCITEDARVYDRILTANEWQTIFATQGKDGIVDGLLFRAIQNDREAGILVTAKNPIDAGPNQIAFEDAFGSPVSEYILGTGFAF